MNHVLNRGIALEEKLKMKKLYNDNMVLASELKDESLSVKIVVIH